MESVSLSQKKCLKEIIEDLKTMKSVTLLSCVLILLRYGASLTVKPALQ